MSKLVNTKLSITLVQRVKELLEIKGWWKGVDGETRQVIDVDGKPTTIFENIKTISAYTLSGALNAAGIEALKTYSQDEVNLAHEIAIIFIEAAIAKHCDDVHFPIMTFNKHASTNGKKVLTVLKTALEAMKDQLK